jgi:hypothetical protein
MNVVLVPTEEFELMNEDSAFELAAVLANNALARQWCAPVSTGANECIGDHVQDVG